MLILRLEAITCVWIQSTLQTVWAKTAHDARCITSPLLFYQADANRIAAVLLVVYWHFGCDLLLFEVMSQWCHLGWWSMDSATASSVIDIWLLFNDSIHIHSVGWLNVVWCASERFRRTPHNLILFNSSTSGSVWGTSMHHPVLSWAPSLSAHMDCLTLKSVFLAALSRKLLVLSLSMQREMWAVGCRSHVHTCLFIYLSTGH